MTRSQRENGGSYVRELSRGTPSALANLPSTGVEDPGNANPVRIFDGLPTSSNVGSVYVHAPFCARRCVYCDFAVHVERSPDPSIWLRAVEAEWEAIRREALLVPETPLRTLYVGGGTPSLLGPSAMEGLARILGRSLLEAHDLEWTAEANPESVDVRLARAWRAAGVNRLSLGAQSFHDGTLRWMGRLHGAEGTRASVRAARRGGITNLSIDLIFGLPAGIGRSWSADLDSALALDVPHISLYGLTVEKETPLGRAVAEGRERVAGEQQYRDEFLLAATRLRQEGYEHYEVSNFARPGFASRHNASYWSVWPYLGLGNGAHSCKLPLRRWNLRDWHAYSREVARGRVPLEGSEELDPSAVRLERIWLGLRTARGVHAPSLPPEARDRVRGWARRGWAEAKGDTVRLTPEGWLILDHLAVELDGAAGA